MGNQSTYNLLVFGLFFLIGISYACSDSSTETIPVSEEISDVSEEDWDKVENGIHVRTGLAHDANFPLIQANCLNCHSSKLITQNRATREGWLQMIRWMQESQGLWDLGENEPFILDYLAEHYAPEETGRRANLEVAGVEWYILELE